ncbi:MAG: hypothetical protein WKG07_22135 [Hymenobacter sp.]
MYVASLGLLLALSRPAAAQKYITAAGVRLGGGNYGLTVQQLVVPRVTIEGIAGLGAREYSGTVLGEYHFGILGPSLNYYLWRGRPPGPQQGHGRLQRPRWHRGR